MGHPEQYPSLEKIRREIRRQVPIYQDLGAHRQGWVTSAGNGAKLSFAMDFSPVIVAADPTRRFIARISPVRHHLGSGTRTSRSGRVREYNDPGAVEISVEDCRALGLSDAGKVRLVSEWGKIERSYVKSRRLPAGLVIVPMAENQNDAMALAALSGSDRAGGFTGTMGRIGIEIIGCKE
jgi:anaerobic selenocysteine-containing dehydrogenase